MHCLKCSSISKFQLCVFLTLCLNRTIFVLWEAYLIMKTRVSGRSLAIFISFSLSICCDDCSPIVRVFVGGVLPFSMHPSRSNLKLWCVLFKSKRVGASKLQTTAVRQYQNVSIALSARVGLSDGKYSSSNPASLGSALANFAGYSGTLLSNWGTPVVWESHFRSGWLKLSGQPRQPTKLIVIGWIR